MNATITALAGLLAAAAVLAAPQDSAIRASSERYSVEALDPGGNDRPARVIVSDRVTSRRHMVMVNSTLGELRRAVIRDDQERITLVSGKGFVVIDPAGRANTDEVYALDAVMSPGGRWVAYRRFYPPTHPGPSDGVAVYDTRQPAERNHAAYPIPQEREWRAGEAVYPPAADWRDANAVHGPEDAYVLTSPLSWEGTSAAPVLLFSMRRGGQEAVVLARVNGGVHACWAVLPGPAERWRVKTLLAQAAGEGHTVKVESSAVADAAAATLTFPQQCSGAVR